MANLVLNNQQFTLLSFDSEKEFEEAVIDNKVSLFGQASIYLDVKKLVGTNNDHARGIPDGYLIDFNDSTRPQMYFVENELLSHDVYRHITEQLARFATAAAVDQIELKRTLTKYIRSQKQLTDQVDKAIQNTPFHNIEDLMNFVIDEHQVRVILCIDEVSPDLNQALNIFKDRPDVVLLERYMCGDQLAYYFDPFRPIEVSQKSYINGSTDYDTVVCAAFEEGFQSAYEEQDAWWAVRLSQEAQQKLKYLAIYQKWPIGAVSHYAEIERIEPYKDSGKYILFLKNKKTIPPIKLDVPYKRGVAPQGPRFTTLEKLLSAKKITDLWK